MNHVDPLQSVGHFKTTLVKGGYPVPARIWCEETRDPDTGDRIGDDRYFAEINGEHVNVFDPPRWPWTKITEQEWQFLTDQAAWARVHAPHSPMANPTVPAHTIDPEIF